ncbi:hypothetical protein J6590_097394, partial [Homalodisca vitripennis]
TETNKQLEDTDVQVVLFNDCTELHNAVFICSYIFAERRVLDKAVRRGGVVLVSKSYLMVDSHYRVRSTDEECAPDLHEDVRQDNTA